ncbi:pilus assembly protein PilW [Pseudoduganella sp. FT25W]|uniref:Pilus assembly protein PilW n=1 Tax=Duganella alba TaxID=2666081 RepID=A0A6L5QJX2_9BURK|nr:PilW family protein [Duganella alba]MRX09612.1 pilus assembly protein PilW [Duganella alba]MRX18385.1 pilus assembly protein PilW [Duganella alba]
MRRLPLPRRSAGFSLVELMVSVVIGMLAILFATRLVLSGEQTKDGAVGGSASMQNGMLALYSISNDAAEAGWGINDTLVAGCNTSFADSAGYALAQITVGGVARTPLAAAVIQPGGSGSDVISLYAGKSAAAVGSLRVNGDLAVGATVLPTSTQTPFGFAAGDVLVVVPEPASPGYTDCSIVQMAGMQSGSNSDKIALASGGGFRFGPASGLAHAYAKGGGRIFNLGSPTLLSFHTWSVSAGTLLLRATDLPGAGPQGMSVTDNIVSIKAQYGLDTRVVPIYNPLPPPNGNGVQLTQWSNTMIDADGDGVVAGPGDFQRVVALRLAVVARSKTAARPGSDGNCHATDAQPTMFNTAVGGAAAVQVSVNVAVADDPVAWQCYTYRVFETVVPVRNAQWRP